MKPSEIRQRQQRLMDRKYRKDLQWIIIITSVILLALLTATHFAGNLFTGLDSLHPFQSAGIVFGCFLTFGIVFIKLIEHKW